ncbi:MAG: sigma-54-dependent Fis family transcriptional regulator, partial [Desulfocapsa sp.]
TYNWKGNVRELENLVQQLAILCSGKEILLEDLPERITENFDPHKVDQEMVNTILNGRQQPSSASHSKEAEQCSNPIPQDGNWEKGQVDFKELINDYESQLIIQAMKMSKGNKKEAAKLLNLKRTTLLEKIKKKGLQKMWE